MHPKVRRSLVGLSALGAIAAVPGTAFAGQVKEAHITSPSAAVFAMPNAGTDYDVAVKGVATVVGSSLGNQVDLYCYGDGGRNEVLSNIDVDPVTKQFSVSDVTLYNGDNDSGSTQADLCGFNASTLRAVPSADNPDTAYDENDPTGSDLRDNFTGPSVAIGDVDLRSINDEWGTGVDLVAAEVGVNPKQQLSDFLVETEQLGGGWELQTLEDGITGNGMTVGSNFREVGDQLFDGGGVELDNAIDESLASGIVVDGVRGFSGEGIDDEFGGILPLGFSPLQVIARSLDSSDGDFRFADRNALTSCADGNGDDFESTQFDEEDPGTGSYCPQMLATGVSAERSYSTSQDGRLVKITDTFSSTDGQSHLLELGYESNWNDGAGDPRYGFGTGPLNVDEEYGEVVPTAAGPLTMIVDSASNRADGHIGETAAAMTWATAPDLIYFDEDDESVAEYTRTVSPGSGPVTITTYVAQAQSIQEADQLAGIAEGPAPGGPSTEQPTNTVVTIVKESQTNTVVSESAPAPAAAPAPAGVQQQSASKAARTCTVPRLRGRTRLSAERALVRAGCAVGKVTKKASRKMQAGRVLKQSKRAGSIQALGTVVKLKVAKRAARRS